MKQQLRHLKLFELGITEWPYQTPYEEMKRVVIAVAITIITGFALLISFC